MGYLEQALAALDSARRTGGRNIQDLFSDPSAYAEKIAGHLRNTNAGVTPVATGGELTNRPLTMSERVDNTLNSLDFGGGMGVIKPKGGNWLSGRYGPEAQLKALRKPVEPTDSALRILADPDPNGATNTSGFDITPAYRQELQQQVDAANKNQALNSWVDNQLTKYVKNDMAAPTDPIRKLADAWPEEKAQKLAVAEARVQKLRQKQQAQAATRGVPEEYLTQTRQDILAAEEARDLIAENTGLHTPVREELPGTESYLMGKRAAEGFPAQGMATTPLGRQWEQQVDSELNPRPVKDFLLTENLKQDPWLAKVDPNAKVNTMMYGTGDLSHITDELYSSLREGRLTPEQLAKMPIDQAVRHVAEINALRKVTANKQQAQDASEIPVFKDYPEQGMSWRQLKPPDWNPELAAKLEQQYPEDFFQEGFERTAKKQLQKWLTQEGDAMGHCVGGYCDDVAEGRSNIYSLRDAKGKPYVTIETTPPDLEGPGSVDDRIGDTIWAQARARFGEEAEGTAPFMEFVEARMRDIVKDRVPMINQIKGPNNETPDPKYFPLIQDFIRSGKWSAIRDERHTGLSQEEIDAILKR